jgi:ATP-dependent Clp protease protease subunit
MFLRTLVAIVVLSSCRTPAVIPHTKTTPPPPVEPVSVPATFAPVDAVFIHLDLPTDTVQKNVHWLQFHGEVSEASINGLLGFFNNAIADKADALVFEIDSVGGNVDAGFALIKAIERVPFPVYCVVDGEADSMAFIILQSCAHRLMTKRSRLMMHQARLLFTPTPDEAKNRSEELQRLTHGLVEHVAVRMHMTAESVLKRIPGTTQWWMNDEEALKYQAVDQLCEGVPAFVRNLRMPKPVEELR